MSSRQWQYSFRYYVIGVSVVNASILYMWLAHGDGPTPALNAYNLTSWFSTWQPGEPTTPAVVEQLASLWSNNLHCVVRSAALRAPTHHHHTHTPHTQPTHPLPLPTP